jgi:hypothetical protein
MRNLLSGLAVLLALVLAGLLGLRAYQSSLQPALSTLDTPFKAVQLIGGQVLYGKLGSAYTNYPVLRDVYVIRRQADPSNQQITSKLVKLGQERMILNSAHIVLIETVNPDSALGKMIAQNEAAGH